MKSRSPSSTKQSWLETAMSTRGDSLAGMTFGPSDAAASQRSPRPIKRLQSWLETALITLGGPLAGMTFSPSDPFWVHASPPWLLLLPLLCGAQYGMVHGLASGALLSVLAFAHSAGSGHAAWIAAALRASR